MASPPFSSGIFGLVKGSDGARSRSLLREATELYVSEPVHTRSETAMYEELAAQLLKVTGLQDRIRIATLLADYSEVPASVMRSLLHDIFPVSSVMIEKSKSISEGQLLALAATASPSHLEMIAARKNLQPAVVEALLGRMRADGLTALAANPSLHFSPSAVRHLVENAHGNPRLARLLAARMDDVQDTDLIDLFLDLDGRGRRRVIQALEIAALREFAARRPLPRVPMPDADKVATLARACLQRNTEAMARMLSDITGLDAPFLVRLLADQGGEPLSICLKAAGVDTGIATRVILFSGVDDTRSYFDVKRLVDLYEMVSLRSALLLVDRWRGVVPAARRAPVHVPQAQAGTPVRATASGGSHGEKPAETPQIRRDRA
ncbi:DUF2336 domain-containing protein [Pleomorphomonas carboxyditropha]|nr:DUF2336 domain-containing protein [Pleomorphomonas carboxyditropha]